jgi:hypothetical protein
MYLFYTRVHLPGEKFNTIDFILIDKDFTEDELKKFYNNYKQKQTEKYKYVEEVNSYYGDPINCRFKYIQPIKDSYVESYLK